jgi:EAL domain-containing protein (putative c-di-GMP-specific phosphodiesterase class I)
VIEEACRDLAAWRRDGIHGVRVAVNLSVQQLLHSDIHVLVTAMLAQHGLKGDDLELEITESAMMQDVEKSIAQLRQLRDLGIKISVDDFGTGYSSLSYLKLLPIDALKIDRSFVTDIAQDANDAMICSVAVTMAKSLRIVTVAEGVETEEQATVVRDLGYDLLQGHLYASPLPAVAAANFIRERNGIGLREVII